MGNSPAERIKGPAYSISEAAQVTGLSARQLRRLSQSPIGRPGYETARGKGTRTYYTADDLVRLRVVGEINALLETSVADGPLTRMAEAFVPAAAEPGAVVVLRSDRVQLMVPPARLRRALDGARVAIVIDVTEAAREVDELLTLFHLPRAPATRAADRTSRVHAWRLLALFWREMRKTVRHRRARDRLDR